MTLQKLASLTFSTITLASLMACVTVNVNFPESTVQKATDDYVKDLYKAKERGHSSTDAAPNPKKTPPKPKPESGPGAGEDPVKPAAGAPTSWIPNLIPQAVAAEADLNFNVNTPKASAIQAKLAAKLAEVDAQKQAGNLGEGNDGQLVVKAKQPLLAKKLEPLVAEQNAARQELYEEIQTANKMSKARLPDVARSFARSFQKASPAGTWIQDAGGAWSQK